MSKSIKWELAILLREAIKGIGSYSQILILLNDKYADNTHAPWYQGYCKRCICKMIKEHIGNEEGLAEILLVSLGFVEGFQKQETKNETQKETRLRYASKLTDLSNTNEDRIIRSFNRALTTAIERVCNSVQNRINMGKPYIPDIGTQQSFYPLQRTVFDHSPLSGRPEKTKEKKENTLISTVNLNKANTNEDIEKKSRQESDLLARCRESFDLISSQMGVGNVDENINIDYFCPMQTTQADGHSENVNLDYLYDTICEDNNSHILLQAEGGLGKTYSFLFLMKRLLENHRPCAYISCNLFTGLRQENETHKILLEKLYLMYLPQHMHNETALREYFRTQTNNPFILFLDGFNEAGFKDQLSTEIIYFNSTFPKIKIIVSSRYAYPIFSNYLHFAMHGLSSSHVTKILYAHNRKYSQLNYSLQRVLLTPMFLRLYLRNDQLDNEIDTAAELMDQERKRILGKIKQSSYTISFPIVEECLNRIFPDFVREQYFSSTSPDRVTSFLGKQLENYLFDHFKTATLSDQLFKLLLDYTIIMKVNDRENIFAYQHEHYRDYWIAYSVLQELLRCVVKLDVTDRVNSIVSILSNNYSQIVLRYIGELAQVNKKGNPLEIVLNCLRKENIHDDSLWVDAKLSLITAKIIDIYKLALESDIVGINLCGLNLSFTNLNQVKTCTLKKKAEFKEALITESTFINSMHISAPRRIEILNMHDTKYIVSISNQDLLISKLPELEPVWRYPHMDIEGKAISTHTLTSSMVLGNCLLAIDSAGEVWEWDFYQVNGIPYTSWLHKHIDAAPAMKVFPWSLDNDLVVALQRKDGTVLLFDKIVNPETNMEALGILSEEYQYDIPELKNLETRKTITSSITHTYIYWAIEQHDGILIMLYNVIDMTVHKLCFIHDPGFIPEYMICVGSEQASRDMNHLSFGASEQDGSFLILTAVKQADQKNLAKTRLYQISLSKSDASHASCILLKWADNCPELINQREKTERPFNRINAISFSNGKMVLAAGDGRIYLFVFDNSKRYFIPNPGVPWVNIADIKFAVEDVLFISDDALAAVTINRFVHLIDVKSLLIKRTLRGSNDGIQKLKWLNDSIVMTTSYDGCLLELVRQGDHYYCRNKIPVGDWCWSLDKISTSIYAVGYISGIALVDIQSGTILSQISGLEQKVEHLLYLPEHGNLLICAIGKVGMRAYHITEKNGIMSIEEASGFEMLTGYSCYWSLLDDNSLFIALGDKEGRPNIARYDLHHPIEEHDPTIIPIESKNGRIQDIHQLSHFLMVSGLRKKDKEESSSLISIIDITEICNPKEVLTIEDFQSFIVHSAVYQIEKKKWRLGVIDLQSNGLLYQYELTETNQGVLCVDHVSEYSFPAVLRDIAFDSKGDLLLTCLNGCLYRKNWLENESKQLFRNKSDMLTFGADMSDLYKPVDEKSQLGAVLTDFGNRLSKPKREFRRSK